MPKPIQIQAFSHAGSVAIVALMDDGRIMEKSRETFSFTYYAAPWLDEPAGAETAEPAETAVWARCPICEMQKWPALNVPSFKTAECLASHLQMHIGRADIYVKGVFEGSK